MRKWEKNIRPWGICFGVFVCCCFIFLGRECLAAHGVSLDGELKYPADFKRFDYTSEQAKQGGRLILHDLGSFDTLNPFTLKGTAPAGLSSYVFETLTVSSLDEPFAGYGLIAKDIRLAEDKLSVVFTLDERARFSDDSPVTVEDVKYSLETLKKDPAHPYYQMYFQDIVSADILSPQAIRFNFARVNRELHMIAGQLPILKKGFYQQHPFGEGGGNSQVFPVGSGPYRIGAMKPGKSIEYVKNEKYWAAEHPVRKGMFNFNSILIKYFKDQTVSVEAFKAGEFDLMLVNIAKQWHRDLVGPRFADKELLKVAFPHKNNAGMQAFVFNTRKKLFQSHTVRQALGLAFDFEWTNNALFYNEYTRNNSFFSNSELAAASLPSQDELKLLKPFEPNLPQDVFTTPLTPPSTSPPHSLRGNLRKAMELLKEEGWTVQNGILKNQDQEPFVFEILLVLPTFARVMAPYVNNLKKIGIQASYRIIDPALYTDRIKSFDYDMTVTTFGQSQSPGNEQRDYWSAGAADQPGSKNLAGIKNPIVDSLVEQIIYAADRKHLVAACRALDRVLWYGYYVVPNWYLANHRLSFIARLRYPEIKPLYYSYEQFLHTWWLD